MHTLTVLYGPPTDVEAFKEYYSTIHKPLALALPGARSTRISLDIVGVGEESPYFALFEADFDSVEAMGQALESPEGQAAQSDTANFATGGLKILHYES